MLKGYLESIMRNSIVIPFKVLAFLGSIMMDPESTKAQNEIMKRIKMYQMKQRNLPNFIRKKREEILAKVNYLFNNAY